MSLTSPNGPPPAAAPVSSGASAPPRRLDLTSVAPWDLLAPRSATNRATTLLALAAIMSLGLQSLGLGFGPM
jgi:hypothetical protein